MAIKVDRQRLAKMAARRKNEGLVAKYDNTKATAVSNAQGFLFGLIFAVIVYLILFPLLVVFDKSENGFLVFLHYFFRAVLRTRLGPLLVDNHDGLGVGHTLLQIAQA